MRRDDGLPAGREQARVVPGGTDPGAVAVAFDHVRRLLVVGGPAVVPREPRSAALGAPPPAVPPGTAVVLATSGSTGRPRLVALGTEALRRHAAAVHDRLGGPGAWLLALPIHHVAGWQVLVRAAATGARAPAVLDTSGGFRASRLPDAVARLPDDAPRYTSLVPTQLVRVLAEPAATAALARLDAVLVGGAAAPPGLLRDARAAGVRVVMTYGATETGGGCVYDGRPLDGVEVAVVEGRLEISGPVLAGGYLGADGTLHDGDRESGFAERAGRRWFRTSDVGRVDAEGRLEVLGRADDVIVSGGVKVHPAAIERLLAALAGVDDVVVVGVPDREWGALVTAIVVPAAGVAAPDVPALRHRVAPVLGPTWAPRAVVALPALPLLSSGKVDRAGAARLAADILARPGTVAG